MSNEENLEKNEVNNDSLSNLGSPELQTSQTPLEELQSEKGQPQSEYPATPEEAASLVEVIAKTCHEVNRAYCVGHGDNSQPSWEDASDNIKKSAIDGVQFVLDNPRSNASALHDNWCAFKIEDGWSYGTEKDVENKTHPCLVGYSELPQLQRVKDKLFRTIVDSFIAE